jgi:hypothetical protein
VADALIVYAQSEEEIFRKTASQCHMEGNTLSVELTQEETFLFDCRKKVQIQVRVLTTEGKALASNIITKDVAKCLSNEVLG